MLMLMLILISIYDACQNHSELLKTSFAKWGRWYFFWSIWRLRYIFYWENKNTKCPIDAHCHRHCRKDLRIIFLSQSTLCSILMLSQLRNTSWKKNVFNDMNSPVPEKILKKSGIPQGSSCFHVLSFFPEKLHSMICSFLLAKIYFKSFLTFSPFFPENFTPRDAHCFWQWSSKK